MEILILSLSVYYSKEIFILIFINLVKILNLDFNQSLIIIYFEDNDSYIQMPNL